MTRVAPPAAVIDRRKYASQAHGPGGKWHVRARKIGGIDKLCLHQTACVLGERPERWDTVGAHLGVLRSGRIVWLHDWTHQVAHANAFNATSIGVEVDGLFAGVKGDDSTVWDDPSTARHEVGMDVACEQIEAVHQIARWVHADLAALGGALRMIVAHRQSSRSRRNDPGSEIWSFGAMPMIRELKLTDGGPGYTMGGLPIPAEWDPSRDPRY